MDVFLYIILGFLILILISMTVYLAIGYFGYRFAMSKKSILKRGIEKRSASKVSAECKAYFNEFEKLDIRSHDNLLLFGFYKSNQSNHLAIVVHGYGGNHLDMFNQCLMFEKRVYDILAIDLRAHGQSEGDMLTMGLYEHQDILRWIDKMLNLNSAFKIVLYGISMGASSVMLTLSENLPANVICAIEDCGFDNANKEFAYVFAKNQFHIKWIYRVFYSYVKNVKKIDLKKIDCCASLKKCKIPVLFIHGGDDHFVPTEMVYNLFKNINENRAQLFIAKGASHGDAFEANPSVYRYTVYTFLKKYLM